MANGGKATRTADQNRAPLPHRYDVSEEESLADTAALQLALAATERRFDATVRRLEKVLRRNALLTQQVALLEEVSAKAQRLAYHDELTGLPNRHLLLDRFQQAVALAARHHTCVMLLFLDLDRFKYINDVLGHSAGDKVLQQISERLVGCIRASDTACRYGGDEFVVLVSEVSDKGGAVAVANNIRARLEAPYIIDGTVVTVTISLGTAIYPIDAYTFEELAQLADLAMYRHKARSATSPRKTVDKRSASAGSAAVGRSMAVQQRT
jgi:diguanylate cyclase (GGDEF)-like protein